MVFGRTGTVNFDHTDYWPIFEVASALQAPLYMHPQMPQISIRKAYYSGFDNDIDSLFAMAGIGWHYEAGMQIVRMALAGVFERFPDLQIITGHMGEVMLFYLDRIDLLNGVSKLPRKVSEYVKQHVFATLIRFVCHGEADAARVSSRSAASLAGSFFLPVREALLFWDETLVGVGLGRGCCGAALFAGTIL